jgi:chemotaxis protein MotB
MKPALVLILLVAVVLGAGTGYYRRESARSAMRADSLSSVLDSLAAEGDALRQRNTALVAALDTQMTVFSRAKQDEMNRLKSTYDELVNDMKAEIAEGQVQITQLADRLNVTMVDRILFPSGEADISPDGLKVLRRVGNILKGTQGKAIRVEGHTDNVAISPKLKDRFPTNWELSTARASNVVRFLQDSVGIDPTRLRAVGLSQYHPVASNTTARGRSQNRRIEIGLLPEATGGSP